MTTYAILSAFVVVPAAVAFERWATLRGRRNADLTEHIGRHRPDTVQPVDDLHLITYPNLYQQYRRRFIDLYGYGAEQGRYWAERKARIAYLRQRAAERRRQRDYVWLAELEADLDREAVKA